MLSNQPTNEELIVRFQKTLDEQVFEQLVLRLTPSALSVARSILHRQSLAEDAVQEAFLKVLCKRDQYNPQQPFAGWFFTLLRNICIDMLRKDHRDKELMAQTIRLQSDPVPAQSQMDRLGLLDQLDEKFRTVLILRIVHSLGFSEIAETLCITEEAAKKRAQRGLSKLRMHLTDSGQIPRLAV